MNDMRDMPVGAQSWYGVPFEVIDPSTNSGKSVITLRGGELTSAMPERSSDIRIDSSIRVLYFLHAAAWGVPSDVGSYVITYEDGTQERIELSIPLNIQNWWKGFHQDEVSRPVPIRISNTLQGKPAWRYLRILEWANPHPAKRVVSVSMRSLGNKPTPILIAISGVSSF